MLLDAVHRAVADRTPLDAATVDGLTIGDRLVLVEVGDVAGVAHRPPGAIDADPTGAPARAVAGWATGSTNGEGRLRRAVGVATLNALSAPLLDWRPGDPFEALSADVDAIATVGLFGPAFRKFGPVDVRVIERRDVQLPTMPSGVTASVFGPESAAAAFDGADVVFVTGSTLLYGGADRYLVAATTAGADEVVLVGATASFLPEPAFAAGATMLAGAQVVAPGAIRDRVAAGECATDLHGDGLAKVYVTRGRATDSALDLD